MMLQVTLTLPEIAILRDAGFIIDVSCGKDFIPDPDAIEDCREHSVLDAFILDYKLIELDLFHKLMIEGEEFEDDEDDADYLEYEQEVCRN